MRVATERLESTDDFVAERVATERLESTNDLVGERVARERLESADDLVAEEVATERLESTDDVVAERLTASDDGNYATNDTLATDGPIDGALKAGALTIQLVLWTQEAVGQIETFQNAIEGGQGAKKWLVEGKEIAWSGAQRSNRHDFSPEAVKELEKAMNNPDELNKMGQAMIMAHSVRQRLSVKCKTNAWKKLMSKVFKEHIEMKGIQHSVDAVGKHLNDYIDGHGKETIVNMARSILLKMHIELNRLLRILIDEHTNVTSPNKQDIPDCDELIPGMKNTTDAEINAKAMTCRNQAIEKRLPWLGLDQTTTWINGHFLYTEKNRKTAQLLQDMLWPKGMDPSKQADVAKSAQKIIGFAGVLRSMALAAKKALLNEADVKLSLVDIWDNIYGCGGYPGYCTMKEEWYTPRVRPEAQNLKQTSPFPIVLGSKFITALMVHWAAHSEKQITAILGNQTRAPDTKQTIHPFFGGVGAVALAKVRAIEHSDSINDPSVYTFQYMDPAWTWKDIGIYLCNWGGYLPEESNCMYLMRRIVDIQSAVTLGQVLAFAGATLKKDGLTASSVGKIGVHITKQYQPFLVASTKGGLLGSMTHGATGSVASHFVNAGTGHLVAGASHVVGTGAVAGAAGAALPVILPAVGVAALSYQLYGIYANWHRDSDDGTDPVTIQECMCDAMRAIENPVPSGQEDPQKAYGIGFLMCNEELPVPKKARKTEQGSKALDVAKGLQYMANSPVVGCHFFWSEQLFKFFSQGSEDTSPPPRGTKGVVTLKESYDSAWFMFLSCAQLVPKKAARAVGDKCKEELTVLCAAEKDLNDLCREKNATQNDPVEYNVQAFSVGEGENGNSTGQFLFRELCDLARGRINKRTAEMKQNEVTCSQAAVTCKDTPAE